MTRSSRVCALVAAGLALGGCGGADGDNRLTPSRGAPSPQRQSTLTPAEYPAMRDWILDEGSSVAGQRRLCETLDAAPETAVIRATRNACDRFLSVLIDIEELTGELRSDLASECGAGYACRARLLRPLRTSFVNLRRIGTAYYRDIAAAMKPGPCRDVLTPAAGLAKLDRLIEEFDRAVDALADGNADPLDAFFEDDEDDDLDDPSPCRPA